MIYIVVGKAEPVTRPRPPQNRAGALHCTRRKQTGLELNTPAYHQFVAEYGRSPMAIIPAVFNRHYRPGVVGSRPTV